MVNNIKSKLLNTLIDSFEKSKTFTGDNINQQHFRVNISRLFPKYEDDSAYDFYREVNAEAEFLASKNLVSLQKEKSGKIKTVTLNVDLLDECYKEIKRIPKADTNTLLLELWAGYEKESFEFPESFCQLNDYISEQKKRLSQNKAIQFFDGDFSDYSDLLKIVRAVLLNKEEIFIRELSVKLFNNSKRLEALENAVRNLLYKYGEYDEKDTVLEEHNIIKTPTYVMVKGSALLDIGEKINLSKIEGDIALSTKTLSVLRSVELFGNKVLTIENLTTFHKYEPNGELVIYLGGFHNQVKRDFIQLVAKCNPCVNFFHFGDIDAGGFYILEHLKAKTKINFIPKNMDAKTLLENKKYWIAITENDKKRLSDLKNKTDSYSETIDFMLLNNCKLEQEAVF